MKTVSIINLKTYWFRFSLVLLSFLIVHSTWSQESDQHGYQMNFAALIVSDAKMSTEWYSGLFNLNELSRNENESIGLVQINLASDEMHLELIQLKGSMGVAELSPKTRLQGFFKLGFAVHDFDSWIDLINQRELNVYGEVVIDPDTGHRMVIILDPDGNRIQLFEN